MALALRLGPGSVDPRQLGCSPADAPARRGAPAPDAMDSGRCAPPLRVRDGHSRSGTRAARIGDEDGSRRFAGRRPRRPTMLTAATLGELERTPVHHFVERDVGASAYSAARSWCVVSGRVMGTHPPGDLIGPTQCHRCHLRSLPSLGARSADTSAISTAFAALPSRRLATLPPRRLDPVLSWVGVLRAASSCRFRVGDPRRAHKFRLTFTRIVQST